MPPWTEIVGEDPQFWLEPLESLPDATVVAEHIRAGEHSKVVALVSYRDDAEASEASRHLPYGYRGHGIEEIVFVREQPIDTIVEFADDAWPGEDRTYVQDDLEAAMDLVVRFAIEYDPVGSVVLVTGNHEFIQRVAELIGSG